MGVDFAATNGVLAEWPFMQENAKKGKSDVAFQKTYGGKKLQQSKSR
jgi:hypothetical protein